MAKLEWNEALKKAGDKGREMKEKAVEAAQKGVEKAADAAQKGAEKAAVAAQKGAEKAVDAAQKGAAALKAETERIKAEKKSEQEKAALEAAGIIPISPQNAVTVFYYLMAIDGNITPDEEEMFESIGKALDPDFDAHREAITEECRAQTGKMIDAEDAYDVLQDGVEAALSREQHSLCGYVTPRLLVWDLLTIAHSDRSYDDGERKLLKYVVRKLGVAKDVFLEMETDLAAIHDIEREMEWIKSTDRPYSAVEKQIRELEKRRSDILLSVKSLIML